MRLIISLEVKHTILGISTLINKFSLKFLLPQLISDIFCHIITKIVIYTWGNNIGKWNQLGLWIIIGYFCRNLFHFFNIYFIHITVISEKYQIFITFNMSLNFCSIPTVIFWEKGQTWGTLFNRVFKAWFSSFIKLF